MNIDSPFDLIALQTKIATLIPDHDLSTKPLVFIRVVKYLIQPSMPGECRIAYGTRKLKIVEPLLERR
jgi:hypothetical protein